MQIFDELIQEVNDKFKYALFGLGDIIIEPEYKNIFVDPINFSKLTSNQKEKYLKNWILSTQLLIKNHCNRLMWTSKFPVSYIIIFVYSNYILVYFIFSGISKQIVKEMYHKASGFLNDTSFIVQRPGENNVYLVPSKYLIYY